VVVISGIISSIILGLVKFGNKHKANNFKNQSKQR
jgi:hypothetical protein